MSADEFITIDKEDYLVLKRIADKIHKLQHLIPKL